MKYRFFPLTSALQIELFLQYYPSMLLDLQILIAPTILEETILSVTNINSNNPETICNKIGLKDS